LRIIEVNDGKYNLKKLGDSNGLAIQSGKSVSFPDHISAIRSVNRLKWRTGPYRPPNLPPLMEMKFTAYLTRHYLITILLILLLFVAVFPYPVEEVPRWKILLIDENYLPGGGRMIVQTVDNGFFRHHTEYKAETDKNGFVTFPERYIWAGVIHRFGKVGASLLGWDTATKVTIRTETGCERGSVEWDTGKPAIDVGPPDKLVCP
jgi:hypothetical protein